MYPLAPQGSAGAALRGPGPSSRNRFLGSREYGRLETPSYSLSATITEVAVESQKDSLWNPENGEASLVARPRLIHSFSGIPPS